MPEIPEKLISIIVYGLISGIVVVGLSFLWRWLSHRYSRLPAADPALLIAIAFLAGETTFRPVPWYAWFGSLILYISGTIKRNFASRLILIVTGAAFLGFWSIQDLWIRGLVVLLTLWLSVSFVFAELLYLLLPLSIAGILTTVPDTEEAGLLLGILIPGILFYWSFRRSEHPGAYPLAGVIAWVICCNGQGRPASIFVSIGCLGMLLAVPLLKMLARKTSNWVLLVLHSVPIAIVLTFGRTTPDISMAIFAAFAGLAASSLALLFLLKK